MKINMVDKESGMTTFLLAVCIAIVVIAAIIAALVVGFFFPPSNYFPDLYTTSTTPSIPLPDNFVNPQIQCTGDGIIAFIPEYILNKNSTYTIKFAENTSTNHPEGLWVLRMKNKETENILVRCV